MEASRAVWEEAALLSVSVCTQGILTIILCISYSALSIIADIAKGHPVRTAHPAKEEHPGCALPPSCILKKVTAVSGMGFPCFPFKMPPDPSDLMKLRGKEGHRGEASLKLQAFVQGWYHQVVS